MTEELLTTKALADTLGISPKRIRAKLRKLYPRAAAEKGFRWKISQDWAKEIEAEVKKPKGLFAAKVISQKGTCAAGHKEGDEFVLGNLTPAGMCPWAFYTIFPFLTVMKFRGHFPWLKEGIDITIACPDPGNPVIFEVRKL